MKHVTITTVSFDELSEAAKHAAFVKWLEATVAAPYPYDHQVDELNKAIEDKTGITFNAAYDYKGFGFSINNISCHAVSFDNQKLAVRGIRAAKAALNIYHQLTQTNYIYGLAHGTNPQCRNLPRYYSGVMGKVLMKYKPSPLKSTNEEFTGYYLSETFSKALFKSVAENTTKTTTLKDHLSKAYSAVLSEVVADINFLQSHECFMDSADDYDYLSNGEIIDLGLEKYGTIEEAETM